MQLVPVSWALAPEILKILKNHFPLTKTSHNKLLNRSLAREHSLEPESILLTPNGQVDSHGTFVFLIPTHRFEIHLNTLNEDLSYLETFADALVSCESIDWNRSPTISCIPGRLYPLLDALQKRLPGNTRSDCHDRSFHISAEEALKFEIRIPKGLRINRLREEHAEMINRLWPHGGTKESYQEVFDYIRLYEAVGLFKQDDEEPIAWCLFGEYGGPGTLQVLEKERGKGYGELCLKAMSIYAARLGFDPHSFINKHNTVSVALFQKLGYKELYPATWTTFQTRTTHVSE